MDELRIASRPLIELTSKSYELRIFTLKMEISIETDRLRITEMQAEVKQLEELLSHTETILKNQ